MENGELYFDANRGEWLITSLGVDEHGRFIQVGGNGLAHPDWVTGWNEYDLEDVNYENLLVIHPAIQIRCGGNINV